MSQPSEARRWLSAYLQANRQRLEPWQIRTVSMLLRSPRTEHLTLAGLADLLRRTAQCGEQDEKPIYMVGAAMAEWLLAEMAQEWRQ